jgi:hypothetical protein
MVTNLQKVAEILNAYFVETAEEIIQQPNYPSKTHIAQSKLEYCSNSIFMLPIAENEVERAIKNTKVHFQQDMMKYRNM